MRLIWAWKFLWLSFSYNLGRKTHPHDHSCCFMDISETKQMTNDLCMTCAYKGERLECMHGVLMHILIMMDANGNKKMWLVYAIYMYVMYA